MWNWTIRRRILGSFGLLLALIFVMGSSVFVEMTGMVKAVAKLRGDALAGLSESNALKAAWTARYLLAEQYGYLEDREASEALAQKLHGQHTQIDDEDAAYKRSISDQEDRDRFDAYQRTAANYVQAEERLIHAAPARRAAENRVALTSDVAPAYSNVEAALKSIDEWNVSVANASAQKVESDARYIRKLIIACFTVIVAVALLACLFLWRAVTQPLGRLLANTEIVSRGDFTNRIALPQRDEFGSLADAFNRMVGELTGLVDQVQKAAIQVNTSVTEIGATSTEQQATATEIAATTTEIGATSREISATSRELVATMTEVAGVAGQTAGLADSGQAGLSRMETAMRGVSEAAGSVSTKLGVLSEKAGNINQVVTTITKVADQTNLLSLNAAIEAEKAGEAGRGFAVVATEIRRLADQTAVATYDIEQTVKEIQSAVSAGVMSMDKFSEQVRRGMHEMQQVGELLSQIIHQVQALAPRFETVNEGMQAQATGAEQISDALTQLTEASQQTVQSLRQSNEAIGGLNQVASALRGAVSRFKLA